LAADLVQHAFLYIGIVMLELVIWLDPLSGAGRVAAEAKRIDDAGLIVANGVKAGVGNGALVLTPVPEPSSFVPMAGGLVVMAFIARRRRRDNGRALVLRGLAHSMSEEAETGCSKQRIAGLSPRQAHLSTAARVAKSASGRLLWASGPAEWTCVQSRAR